MAKRIQGAKLVELAEADHIPYVGDSDALLDEIEEFLTGDSSWRRAGSNFGNSYFHRYRRLYKAGSRVGAVPWPGGEHGGRLFPDRF